MKFNFSRRDKQAAIPQGQRVYAIGDIHGRLDLYDALIQKIRADDASRSLAITTLVLLGDLVDRGPQSREVIARARAGVPWARTIAIMGNHEAVMMDVIDGDIGLLRDWLKFGGRDTLASWGIRIERIDNAAFDDLLKIIRTAVTAEERRWISRMRPYAKIGDYYFVHAGIRPGVGLDEQTTRDQMWIRDDFLDSRKDHGAVIVHGHTISEAVVERPNRIGLDTGAYATGRLTALGLEGAKRWFLSTAK